MKEFQSKKSDKEKKEKIEMLRQLARQHLDAHNHLINQYWDLDRQEVDSTDTTIKQNINTQKEFIMKHLDENHHETKLNELLEQIKTLEIELYGKSNIGDPSFNVL